MTKAPGTTSTEMIACTKAQKQWMADHGKFGQTFADILQMLIDSYEKKK